jgi:hypothetical protein
LESVVELGLWSRRDRVEEVRGRKLDVSLRRMRWGRGRVGADEILKKARELRFGKIKSLILDVDAYQTPNPRKGSCLLDNHRTSPHVTCEAPRWYSVDIVVDYV